MTRVTASWLHVSWRKSCTDILRSGFLVRAMGRAASLLNIRV